MVRVILIKVGYSNAYLVSENGKWLMVDTGLTNKQKIIQSKFNQLGISAEDLSLIIVTHAHYDHVGNLRWVREASNAPVIVHESEKIILEQGIKTVPDGTNNLAGFLSRLGKLFYPKKMFDSVEPDITLNEVMSLKDFGFSAVLIPTPGHTTGSISLLFGSGETFTGDTCFRFLGSKSVFPIFANDIPTLLKSWETLLNSEARIFYPGHGKPFDKETLKASYDQQKNKIFYEVTGTRDFG